MRNSPCLTFSFLIIVARPILSQYFFATPSQQPMSYLFSNLKRSFSSVSLTATAQRIQNLLQPAKITAGLLPEDLGSSVEFKLRNGTDHFTLPLQRIVFTYSPQKGDSSALM